ncbi:MAG TPA: glycerate kinase [Sulfurospirillum arcachonense]|nr:glycerate kinase [Sulfurospirillum arcachonense]HIP44859.1 glycerate kinase [Sulfurospirillum arcachonense]
MKVVVAIDSFKGCASSLELAEHIKEGILDVYPDGEIVICPIADGGEGTVEAFSKNDGVRLIRATCKDPLGNNIQAQYTILKDNVAVIEMASASGLPLIALEKRDPSLTSSYGTGDLIKDAIKKGVREFIVGLGGSATNDAGLGMLISLGFRFLDKLGNEISFARDLGDVITIDKSKILKELKECNFRVACDVNNPLFGKNGATHVYAKQKGANQKMVIDLDKQLECFAKVVEEKSSKKLYDYPGAGAAGGMGFAFLVFLNAKLKSGIKIVLEQLDLENKIKDANFVITGEGKIDEQSSMGKVLSGIGGICKKQGVPCIALSGNSSEASDGLHKIGVSAYFSILDAPISLGEAMNKRVALDLIRKKTKQIFRLIKVSNQI